MNESDRSITITVVLALSALGFIVEAFMGARISGSASAVIVVIAAVADHRIRAMGLSPKRLELTRGIVFSFTLLALMSCSWLTRFDA